MLPDAKRGRHWSGQEDTPAAAAEESPRRRVHDELVRSDDLRAGEFIQTEKLTVGSLPNAEPCACSVECARLRAEVQSLKRELKNLKMKSGAPSGVEGRRRKRTTGPKASRDGVASSSSDLRERAIVTNLEWLDAVSRRVERTRELLLSDLHIVRGGVRGDPRAGRTLRDSPGSTRAVYPRERRAQPMDRPRVIEDIQLVPPRARGEFTDENPAAASRPVRDRETTDDVLWTEVVRRRGSRASPSTPAVPSRASCTPRRRENRDSRPSARLRRGLPKHSAVAIAARPGGPTPANIVRTLRRGISLAEMGIERTSVRHTADGRALILVHGKDSAAGADLLASRARLMLGDAATVDRPVLRADVRIRGVDSSVAVGDIADALASAGECPVSEIRVGRLSFVAVDYGIVRASLPLASAIRASSTGLLRVGWSSARISRVSGGPLRCHRCWEYGHVQSACTGPHDRRANCFRCGVAGHSVETCIGEPRCAICVNGGFDAAHTMGTSRCGARGAAVLAEASRRARNKTRHFPR